MSLALVLAFIFGYDAEFVCGTLRLKDEELVSLLAARPDNVIETDQNGLSVTTSAGKSQRWNYVLRQKDMRFS